MEGTDTQQIMEKLQKANKLMEDLIDLTMADKEISEEEKKILFCINDYLNDYVRIIITTVSDNKITEEEKKELKEIEQNIISDAKKIAMEDSYLSDDERALLDSLVKAVNDLSME
ncbi:MAG: hypothetical protein ACXAD7_16085 [Candidatus Kariarchaeaceae archaeon]|jgi:hypothetical protein